MSIKQSQSTEAEIRLSTELGEIQIHGVAARRSVILSLLYDRKPGASREEFEAECEADEALARHMEVCEDRYGRYLALCDSMEGGAAAGRRAAS